MPIDHFGCIAPQYDRVFKPRLDENWLRLLGLPSSGTLLEIGGGTGRISQMFEGKVDQIITLDESMQMLYQAREKRCISLVQGHAEQLPFADAALDRVLLVDSYHHFRDHSQAAQEIVRVLKPGGKMLIEEPDIRWLSVKMIALMEKILGMRSRFFRGEEITALFRGLQMCIRLEYKKGILWVVGDRI